MSASLVSPDAALRSHLRALLEPRGFTVRETASPAQAIEHLRRSPSRLVILDLDAAGDGRHDMVRRLKAASGAALIALSTSADDADTIGALDHGADDYIVLPFNPDVLLARISANLRTRPAGRAAPAACLENGPLRIDPQRHEVRVAGRVIRFSPKAFEILRQLVRHKGEPVANKDLLKEVWGEAHAKDDHYLRVYICQIRKKLKPANLQDAISWAPAGGYRMEALERFPKSVTHFSD